MVRIPSSILGKCVSDWKLNPLTCSLQYSNMYGSYDCKQGYSSLSWVYISLCNGSIL